MEFLRVVPPVHIGYIIEVILPLRPRSFTVERVREYNRFSCHHKIDPADYANVILVFASD